MAKRKTTIVPPEGFEALTKRVREVSMARPKAKRRRVMPESPLDRSPLQRIGVIPAATKATAPPARLPEDTVGGGQRTKVRRTVWLSPDLDTRLSRYASEQERDLSWIVQKALESMLP